MLSPRIIRHKKDSVWLLLDRATIRFVDGDINGAIEDFHAAIEAIDYYNQDTLTEKLGQVLVSDEVAAYAGEDYEKVMAYLYFALALLHKGDASNAYALLRQGEELQQRLRELYGSHTVTDEFIVSDNPVSKFLFAALLEKRGDTSNAEILYRQAKMPVIKPLPLPDHTATVLVLCHNGNIPRKITDTVPASQASAAALEIILASFGNHPAISSLTGIPVPALQDWEGGYPANLSVQLDDKRQPFHPLFDVSEVAYQELMQKQPIRIARGAARMAARRGLVATAHAKDAMLGDFVDLLMLFANASTTADTRSWATLPNVIDVARFDVRPGVHSLEIEGAGAYTLKDTLTLHNHDLCVVNIFQIHPGVMRVLVPK